jgi:hypothetical protein
MFLLIEQRARMRLYPRENIAPPVGAPKADTITAHYKGIG